MVMRERAFVDVAVFRYRSGYREINALLAVPNASTPMPGILLAHDVFGLDAHMEDIAVRFAREGYAVLVPDFYSTRGGPGNDVDTLDGQRRIRLESADTLAVGDITNGYNFLAGQDYVDPARVAVLGFGYGGTVALIAASKNQDFAAAVNFYGDVTYPPKLISRTKPDSPANLVQFINCPTLSIYGAPDNNISRQDVQVLEKKLREKGKTFDIKVFPGVANGFFNDRTPTYSANAAREAFGLTLNWLGDLLSPIRP